MKLHSILKITGTFFLLLLFVGCSKPKLYGTLQESEPIVREYKVPPQELFRAAKEALVYRGYSLKVADDANLTLETYWQPTPADSHFVRVFGRPDYGTVGAYYRLVLKVSARGDGSKLTITNAAKSIISNLKSSGRAEAQVIEKIDDFTRKRDIQVTNIGLQ